MRAIASIHTATQCLFCSAALVLGACTTRQTYYTPSEDQPRMTPDLLRDRGHNIVRAECPRLIGVNEMATGVAHIRLDVESNGDVRRAAIEHSSGDERMDEIFGGLAAQLKVDPPSGMNAETVPATVRIGYSCSRTSGTITLEGVTATG